MNVKTIAYTMSRAGVIVHASAPLVRFHDAVNDETGSPKGENKSGERYMGFEHVGIIAAHLIA